MAPRWPQRGLVVHVVFVAVAAAVVFLLAVAAVCVGSVVGVDVVVSAVSAVSAIVPAAAAAAAAVVGGGGVVVVECYCYLINIIDGPPDLYHSLKVHNCRHFCLLDCQNDAPA